MGKKRNLRKKEAFHSDDEDESDNPQVRGRTNEGSNALEKQKLLKSRSKAAFTRARHGLLQLLEEDLPSRSQVREVREKLNRQLDKVMEDLETLSTMYDKKRDTVNISKLSQEIERIEEEFTDAQNRTQEYLDSRKDELSSTASDISQTFRQAQEEVIKVKKKAEQIEANMLKEEAIQTEKRKLEEEYTKKMKELEDRSLQRRHQLIDVKEEVKRIQERAEKEIDRELGLEENYGEVGEGEQEPRIKTENASGLTNKSQKKKECVKAKASPAMEIGQDLWKQLKRVSIPVFNGDKSNYENWKAAFEACIDKAPATPEYKLLQLRQYLSGEALKTIESLGHSASAYEAAKSRLERKYGGRRRQIALHLEELENFKPVRPRYPKDIERFADILDIAVVNLREARRYEELGNGSLYAKLKMTEQMLAQYHRWIYEKSKTECVETLREWVIQEAEFQTIAAETLRGISKSSSGTQRKDQTYFGQPRHQSGPKNQQRDRNRACKVCGEGHPIWLCDKFKGMSIPKRWEIAKQHSLCYRCLGANHVGQSCTRSRICGLNGCKNSHNRLLHGDKRSISDKEKSVSVQKTNASQDAKQGNRGPATEGEQQKSETSLTTTVHAKEIVKEEFIALRTVSVILKNGGRKLVVNALLDDTSTKTYLNSDVAAELGLQGENCKVTVNVLNGQEDTFETMPVECGIESLDGKVNMKITAFTTKRATGNMRAFNWAIYAKNWNHLKDINFPYLGPRPIVDILIGIDYADLHYSIKDVRGKPGEPVARLTPLGWTCIGHPSVCHKKDYWTNFIRTHFVREELSIELGNAIRKFWEIEDYGLQAKIKLLRTEDQVALEALKKSINFEDGRYEIGVPWKKEKPFMPDNYEAALRRLQNTEKRLCREPEIGKSYSDVISQYEEKGYIRKVPETEKKPSESWYLPHFAVVRPDKATTKTRIVFDASAKCNGIALNDVIYQGPKLQRELFSVLLRFRKKPIALVCDIAEMYLRISLAPEDRPFHRFLWRSLDETRTPDVYEFNRVVFGVNSSPFQAQFVTQEHALKNKEQFPMAAETILKSTYMDDSMDSTSDDQTGIELYRQLSELWGKAGMHARKWLSNSSKVLEQIPVDDRASEVDLDQDHLPSVKTLGVLWVAEEDMFTYKAHSPGKEFKFTKRNFLKSLATLFDPLGFLAPYIILQEMWTTGIDWDEQMEEEQARKARQWFQELESLQCLRIPRCLQPNFGELISTSLHSFADSSTEAYGAVVYARNEYKSGNVTVRMVASKSKVAPLTAMSIGRLELMGAVLGLRLSMSIAKALDIESSLITYWSDSMNVLWWIHRPSRVFKSFVANRIGEIQSASYPNQWRYEPTNENPADFVTRGLTVPELAERNSWWEGPSYLKEKPSEWPINKITHVSESETEVRKKSQYQLDTSVARSRTMVAIEGDNQSRLEPKRFSSWLRLTRTQAWIYRFLNNCFLPSSKRTRGELTAEEIQDAELRIIKTAQKRSFETEYSALSSGKPLLMSSKLLMLKPRKDEDGVMRSDGRLENAEYLPYDVKYPIILPRKEWVTKLIVR